MRDLYRMDLMVVERPVTIHLLLDPDFLQLHVWAADTEQAQQPQEVVEAAAVVVVQIRQVQVEAELQGHLAKDTMEEQEAHFQVALVVVQELQVVVRPEMAA